MRKLLTLLALLAVPPLAAAAEDNASRSPSHQALWTMLCTQEGVAKGHRNKALDEFVGKCVKARKSGEKNDEPADIPEMANC